MNENDPYTHKSFAWTLWKFDVSEILGPLSVVFGLLSGIGRCTKSSVVQNQPLYKIGRFP
jgi:hypothetical protein